MLDESRDVAVSFAILVVCPFLTDVAVDSFSITPALHLLFFSLALPVFDCVSTIENAYMNSPIY